MVTIPVGIQPGTHALRLERVEHSYWILWLHTKDFKSGTYLELHDNGQIQRVTAFADGMEEKLEIKPKDVQFYTECVGDHMNRYGLCFYEKRKKK